MRTKRDLNTRGRMDINPSCHGSPSWRHRTAAECEAILNDGIVEMAEQTVWTIANFHCCKTRKWLKVRDSIMIQHALSVSVCLSL